MPSLVYRPNRLDMPAREAKKFDVSRVFACEFDRLAFAAEPRAQPLKGRRGSGPPNLDGPPQLFMNSVITVT